MDEFNLAIAAVSGDDRKTISDFITDNWGSHLIVSKGHIHNVENLPGFICKRDGKIAGLITYHIVNCECEIVTLDSIINGKGLGTQLIQLVINAAKSKSCLRVWLLTTNDNTKAIRFYQKRGFEWIGFYRNAIETSRTLKQTIPEFGNDGIPIKHEIEFEYLLDKSF